MLAHVTRFFHLSDRGTTVATEVRAGVTTFLTMAYILFVNPSILSGPALGERGLAFSAAAAGTALAAAFACILMGVVANFPLALASGMGLNAFVAYTIIASAGVSWQAAMGLVVLDGLIVLLLVLAGVREWVLKTIPLDLKRSIGAGIGLFLAFTGLVNARLVVVPGGSVAAYAKAVAEGQVPPALPPVTHGDVGTFGIFLVVFGLVVTAVLHARKVRGAILIGIIATTVVSIARDLLVGLDNAAVRSLRFTGPDFSAVGGVDIVGALQPTLLPFLLGLLVVDFFDTIGTVTAIGEQAGLMQPDGSIPGATSVLAVDAIGAVAGGLCGASSVTSYIESAAGVGEGGRTGLMPVVTGLLFLVSLLLAPLFGLVPAEATAPALIFVGCLMMRSLAGLQWDDMRTAIPAFVALIVMPATYSISHGIGYAFIAYVLVSVFSGKGREVHPMMYGVAAVFAVSFAITRA